MLLGATVSMFGYMSGDMLGTPRLTLRPTSGATESSPNPSRGFTGSGAFPYVAIAVHATVVGTLAAQRQLFRSWRFSPTCRR